MPPKGKRFNRPLGERRYKKVFVLAVEGTVSEPLYFDIFNDRRTMIHVDCLKNRRGSAPQHVLQGMKEHLKRKGLKDDDEAWLVVDKDAWTDEQLSKLYAWTKERPNRGLALSNPGFEYWLLLHFDDGTDITSQKKCDERLKRHLPGYDKGFAARTFTPEHITTAVKHARRRDNPPCTDWPREPGRTTVYRLVESILRSSGTA